MALERVRNGRTVDPRWTIVAVAGWLVLTASLAWLAGLAGVAAGLAIGVLLVTLPGPLALAGGHVLVLGLDLASLPVWWIVWFEAGFLGVLAGALVTRTRRRRTLAVFIASGLSFGAIGWFGWQRWEPRWLVGLALVSLVGLALYGLHRYSVVALTTRGVRVEL